MFLTNNSCWWRKKYSPIIQGCMNYVLLLLWYVMFLPNLPESASRKRRLCAKFAGKKIYWLHSKLHIHLEVWANPPKFLKIFLAPKGETKLWIFEVKSKRLKLSTFFDRNDLERFKFNFPTIGMCQFTSFFNMGTKKGPY